MQIIDRVKAFREAGSVKRCHVIPIIGEYTVGKHSYDALSLLLCLHLDPSINLIKAVLWHDSAERWWGDLPAPAKWANTHLKTIYERAENSKLDELGARCALTEDEQHWLRAVDSLEFWMFAMEQVFMGNRNMEGPCKGIAEAIRTNMATPPEAWAFFNSYVCGRGPERP